jgi:hypothetical protein
MNENILLEQEAFRSERETLLCEDEAETPVPTPIPTVRDEPDVDGSDNLLQLESSLLRSVQILPGHGEQRGVSPNTMPPGDAPSHDSTLPTSRTDNQPGGDELGSGNQSTSVEAKKVKSRKNRQGRWHNAIERRWKLARTIIRDWHGEFVASVVFIGFLLATIFTLRSCDGKPLPQYSINTLLSFYSVMLEGSVAYIVGATISQNQWRWFKSKEPKQPEPRQPEERPLYDIVRYDEAAREPLGAFKYLLSRRFEPLTALGAIVLISTLFIDPFVQQLLNFINCSTDLTESASIPRTSYYSPNMTHQGAEDASPLPGQTSAWNTGMFADPLADVSFSCSTGNCTFPAQYSTVGFCSQCTDISDSLTFNTSSLFGIVSAIPGGLSVNYNTSDINAIGWSVFGMGFNSKSGAFEIIQARQSWPTSNQTLSDDNTLPTGCDNNSASANSWHCRGYGAVSCLVGQCVRTYQASIQAGQLTETLVDNTQPFSGWGDSFVDNLQMNSMVDTHCISPDEIHGLTSNGYVISPQNRWLQFNLTPPEGYIYTDSIPANATFPLSMFTKGCVYMIPYVFVQGFYEYFLGSLLNGTVLADRGAGGLASGFSGPQVLQRLYNYGSTNFTWIDSIMANGSTALTNYMRLTGVTAGQFSTPAPGVVSHFATCVQIQWEWILLPAISGGLSLILLALSIGYGYAEEMPVWKSSPLAFIFHTERQKLTPVKNNANLEQVQPSVAIPTTISGMKHSAKKMIVRLDKAYSGSVVRWWEVESNKKASDNV